jgi:hypothetical protein
MTRWLRPLLLVVVLVVLVLVGLAAVRLYQASRAGERGQHALVDAVALMTPQHGFASLDSTTLDKVHARIAAAQKDFREMKSDLAGAGPAYSFARVVPFIRVQVRGVKALNNAGNELTASALQLVDTARRFVNPSHRATTLSNGDVIGDLRILQSAASQAATSLSKAIDDLSSLNGYRLVGPLSSARSTLAKKLPRLEVRAASARDGLTAFIAFAGGNGPQRYLVLSQNPDEVRPTGGFMGSYGLLSSKAGHLKVDEYGDTNAWDNARPAAVIPEKHAEPTIFRIADTNETMANTNARPDWPTAAKTAIQLWQKGGGPAVNGVVSFTPNFLARLVAVFGPIRVPAYNDTITGANLVARTDYWTHHAPSQPVPGGRKEFLSVLAPLVLHKLVTEPASQWPKLGAAVGDGFAKQEAMLWSGDKNVQNVVTAHRWDYTLPRSQSDFYADAEFEFASKNGSKLHRDFTHTVVVRGDGSAVVTTVMKITDTDPVFDSGYNPGIGGYFTPYGPHGATLDNASDKPDWDGEPDVAGHPSAGWQLFAHPGGTTALKVVWDVPQILIAQGHGHYLYSLIWMPTPAHTGDVVHLRVELPAGWTWLGASPPATLRPDSITGGNWELRKAS